MHEAAVYVLVTFVAPLLLIACTIGNAPPAKKRL
jgi:hypothetical protein